MQLVIDALGAALHLVLSGDLELRRVAALSLLVSGIATLLAAALGIPVGAALHLRRFPGREAMQVLVTTGMGIPPVLVGLAVTLLLWRTGPLGALRLLYTPAAMILAQVLVALPIVAGLTRSALSLLGPEETEALRVDGAAEWRVGAELLRAALPQVLVAVAAGFGRALSEVGASLMVGGNILGQTRILTTAIALQTGRGEFALALALGLVLLALALVVNVAIGAFGRLVSPEPPS